MMKLARLRRDLSMITPGLTITQVIAADQELASIGATA